MTPAEVKRKMKHLQARWGKYYGRDRMMEDIVDFYHSVLSSMADGKCQSMMNCAAIALRVEEKIDESAPAVDSRPGKEQAPK